MVHQFARAWLVGSLAAILLACAAPTTAPRPTTAGASTGASTAPAPAGASTESAAPAVPGGVAATSGAASAPVTPTRLRIAYTAISGGSWPTWIAHDAGVCVQLMECREAERLPPKNSA